MKVLAIIGSPRKGHSYQVTQQIERRLKQNGDVRVEYVFLSQMNLQACRGCYVCQSLGEQYCPLEDDRADLVKRMRQADGTILVSPAYTGNVSGLMKNLMDRLAYTAHRPAFFAGELLGELEYAFKTCCPDREGIRINFRETGNGHTIFHISPKRANCSAQLQPAEMTDVDAKQFRAVCRQNSVSLKIMVEDLAVRPGIE